jgi:hypothetical protein
MLAIQSRRSIERRAIGHCRLIVAFFAVISVLVFYFLVVPEPLKVKEQVSQIVSQKIGV